MNTNTNDAPIRCPFGGRKKGQNKTKIISAKKILKKTFKKIKWFFNGLRRVWKLLVKPGIVDLWKRLKERCKTIYQPEYGVLLIVVALLLVVCGVAGSFDTISKRANTHIDKANLLLEAPNNEVDANNATTEQEGEITENVSTPTLKSNEEIADEVIAGTWGCGEEREQKLKEAGYDPVIIQELVNAKASAAPSQSEIVQIIPSNVTVTNPSERATIIWNTMRSWGWSREVCAGILGNLQCENGTFDPNREGCGYGICQWTSGRYYNLINTYGSMPTLENELEYMRTEMYGGQYMGSLDNFFSSTTPESAALAFAQCFERCGSGSYGTRQAFARQWYNTYG